MIVTRYHNTMLRDLIREGMGHDTEIVREMTLRLEGHARLLSALERGLGAQGDALDFSDPDAVSEALSDMAERADELEEEVQDERKERIEARNMLREIDRRLDDLRDWMGVSA